MEVDCTRQRCCTIELTIPERDRTGCLLNCIGAPIYRYQLRGNGRLTPVNQNTGCSTGDSGFIEDSRTAVNRNSRRPFKSASINRQCTGRSQTSFETAFGSNE